MAIIVIIISNMGSILVDFERKLERQQYVSVALFNKVKKRAPEQALRQFSLEQYNDEILDSEYAKSKEFFDIILNEVSPKPNLSRNQAKAILAEEKRKLIIAGTNRDATAMTIAEVRYLAEVKRIAPENILVIASTERGMEILKESINDILGLSTNIATLRSIGYQHIRQVLRYKNCYAVSENERDHIFLKYLKKRILVNYEKIEDFMDCFDGGSTDEPHRIGDYFRKNYGRFAGFDDYFDSYIKDKVAKIANINARLKRHINDRLNGAMPRTMIGEYVRNKDEAMIANWLFRHSIDYKYAQPFDDLLPTDVNSFRPDFTLNIGGRKVCVEFFGSGIDGTKKANARIRNAKESLHRKNHTNLIALDYEPNYGYLETLQRKLEELGMHLPRERSAQNAYLALVKRDPLVEFRDIRDLFYEIIDTAKISPDRKRLGDKIEKYFDNLDSLDTRVLAEKQYKYIRDFYGFYSAEIHRDSDRLGFDSADMLYYAKINIERADEQLSRYRYIILEEPSDGSAYGCELLRNIMSHSKAEVIIIGNDWQTAYANAGLKAVNLKCFRSSLDDVKTFSPAETPRDSAPLMNASGDYVLRDSQHTRASIESGGFSGEDSFVFLNCQGENGEMNQIKNAILSLHRQRPNDKILVLVDTNESAKALFKSDANLQKRSGMKACFMEAPDYEFDLAATAKAKSTLFDWVIVAGLDNIKQTKPCEPAFWMMELLSSAPKRDARFDAEQKVVCEALMRARYKVILPIDTSSIARNTFINKLYCALRGEK